MASKLNLLLPLESAKFIMARAKEVSISAKGVQRVADFISKALRTGQLSSSSKNFKQCELYPKQADEAAIDWIFLADTLNFSFWSENPKWWQVQYNGKEYSGYFALCAGINRALEEGIDILNPAVFGSFTEADILRILRSTTTAEIPMVADRVKNLREASQVLLAKYGGSFVNCVKASNHNAQKLLSTIVTEFQSYADQNEFEGTQVTFWKRAQILIGDIWACFEGQGLGRFDNIDTLTMFADYRIPQDLVHFGAMEYSKELYEALQKDEILENGDRREIEIRAASILVVEEIKDKIQQKEQPEPINSILIDHFLWDYRREHVQETDTIPYHKVRCIYY